MVYSIDGSSIEIQVLNASANEDIYTLKLLCNTNTIEALCKYSSRRGTIPSIIVFKDSSWFFLGIPVVIDNTLSDMVLTTYPSGVNIKLAGSPKDV